MWSQISCFIEIYHCNVYITGNLTSLQPCEIHKKPTEKLKIQYYVHKYLECITYNPLVLMITNAFIYICFSIIGGLQE